MFQELKPCPLCGGKDLYTYQRDEELKVICCKNCGAVAAADSWSTRADLPPAVKPLVWRRLRKSCYVSNTIFASFCVETYGGGFWRSSWAGWGCCNNFASGDFPSADAAKDATQEKYAAYVLSCLAGGD